MSLGFEACSTIAESAIKSKTLSVIHLSRNGLSSDEKKLISKQFGIPEIDLIHAEECKRKTDLMPTVNEDKEIS